MLIKMIKHEKHIDKRTKVSENYWKIISSTGNYDDFSSRQHSEPVAGGVLKKSYP